MLIASVALSSLAMGLITLSPNGFAFDMCLGVAGLASAAHIPIVSSILSSIYTVPSTRRQYVFTFFLAGGNAFSVLFGGLCSGLVDTALGGDWRASFIYISTLFAAVAVAGVFILPNVPNTPQELATPLDQTRSEDQYPLLGPVTERLLFRARD